MGKSRHFNIVPNYKLIAGRNNHAPSSYHRILNVHRGTNSLPPMFGTDVFEYFGVSAT